MLQEQASPRRLLVFHFVKRRVTEKIFTIKEKNTRIANNLYANMYVFNVALALIMKELRIGAFLPRCEGSAKIL